MAVKNVRRGNGVTNKVNNIGGLRKKASNKPVEEIDEEIISYENEYDLDDEIEEIEDNEPIDEMEEISNEELEEEYIDDEELEEEKISNVNKSVENSNKNKQVTKRNTKIKPLNKTPIEIGSKKKLGGTKTKKEKSNNIGKVYPIEKLVENIQSRLDERFEGITKKDSEIIFRVVEEELYKAASEATVRVFGGTMKSKEKAPSITSPSKTKEDYYKSERIELCLEGCIISDYEMYSGYKNEKNNTFEAHAIKNKKTKKYEEIDTLIIPLKKKN